MKKHGIDLAKHQEIGQELSRIYDYITDLTVIIANNYPLRIHGGRHMRAIEKARIGLSLLRSELDALLLEDIPDADMSTYYPHARIR